MTLSPSPAPRAARLARAGLVLLLVALSGCGGTTPALEGSLNDAQISGLDRAWSQRIRAVSADDATAADEATNLYKACAAMDQGSTFLQAVHATCAPTSVSVKLGAVLAKRCASPTSQCVRALDRAKAANDTLLAALLQLSDAVKSATDSTDCRAEFTTDATRADAYRALSAAYDALALGVERKDSDIQELGQRRVDEAEASIRSRLSTTEQIARFRQACGISDDA